MNKNTKTIVEFFAGGGGVGLGAKQAGITPIQAYEIDDKISNVYRANIGDHCQTVDILEIDNDSIPDADYYWFSPPCQSFSAIVNVTNKSKPRDNMGFANKIADIISHKKPDNVIIENVPKYLKSKEIEIIKSTLIELGYNVDVCIVKSCDFGVPQLRKRMILRAKLNGKLEDLSLFHVEDRVGWYDVLWPHIDDMVVGNLKPFHIGFTQVHIDRNGENFPYLVGGGQNSKQALKKANTGYNGAVKTKHQMSHTITTSPYYGTMIITKDSWQNNKGYLLGHSLNGLLQTFPLDYVYPIKRDGTIHKTLSYKVVGNAVPPLLAEKILISMT